MPKVTVKFSGKAFFLVKTLQKENGAEKLNKQTLIFFSG
jgi:hypothetical protein